MSKSRLLMALLVILSLQICAQDKLMQIKKATIKKIGIDHFRITVQGMAPTPGWKIYNYPYRYITIPENWEIAIKGTRPQGFVIQVLTPYSYSFDMGLSKQTKKVTLVGSNRTIELNVPHPREASLQTTAIIAQIATPEKNMRSKVQLGELFLVQVVIPVGFDFAKTPTKSKYFSHLGTFTYTDAADRLHRVFACKMKDEVEEQSFPVTLPGQNKDGHRLLWKTQILVQSK